MAEENGPDRAAQLQALRRLLGEVKDEALRHEIVAGIVKYGVECSLEAMKAAAHAMQRSTERHVTPTMLREDPALYRYLCGAIAPHAAKSEAIREVLRLAADWIEEAKIGGYYNLGFADSRDGAMREVLEHLRELTPVAVMDLVGYELPAGQTQEIIAAIIQSIEALEGLK